MALRILDTGSHDDTWAGFARPWDSYVSGQKTPAFAKSHAYSLLIRELNRYLQHQVRGRSFLISGHRGSGKTSLVLRAVQDLQNRHTGDLEQRPLLVKLHGPSLLAPITNQKQNEDQKDANGANDGSYSAALAVLVEITISLYRSLCGEVARCYRDHVILKRESGNEEDFLELAGQLSMELDNAPGPALLREFWERVDALQSGVLGVRYAKEQSDPSLWRRPRWSAMGKLLRATPSKYLSDQGIREVIAISTAAQAFQVVSGSITYQEVKKNSALQDKARQTEVKLPLKEIVNSMGGLAAGVLVGFSAYAKKETGGVISSAVLGLLTAMVTGFALTWSTTRKRTKSITREHTFIRERDVSTLDRELPIVIERVRAAGLAPVFVVDELDKVENLFESMAHLVQRLKHLVADYSFFCFLTDRDYFEDLHNLFQYSAYPKEHTYFSHRLFVLYRPDDLHEYLDQLIKVEDGGSKEETGKFALSYLLLHRAMMHTFDIQREVAKACDDEGRIIISTGELRTDLGYRYQIMIQLAIEILLNEPELRDRLNQDPQFGQLVYDVLYMPTRKWLSGEPELDLSDESIEVYLYDRLKPKDLAASNLRNAHSPTTKKDMAPVQQADPKDGQNDGLAGSPLQPESGEKTGEQDEGILVGRVRETDRRYLIALVRRLAEMLIEPNLIVARITEAGMDDVRMAAVVDAIPMSDVIEQTDSPSEQDQPERTPLIRKLNEEGTCFRWYRDPYGRKLFEEELLDELIDVEDQEGSQQFIDAVVEKVQHICGTRIYPDQLAEMGILKRSPDWEQIKIAGERLSLFRQDGQIYEELIPHQESLHEYADMLARRGILLAKSLAAGFKIGLEAEISDRDMQVASGVKALSDLLELPTLEIGAAEGRLDRFVEQHVPVEVTVPPISRESVDEWADALAKLFDAIIKESILSLDVHRDSVWRKINKRIESYLLGEEATEDDFGIDGAACIAAEVTPPLALMKPVNEILIHDASKMINLSLKDETVDSKSYVPFWAVTPLFYLLGLPEIARRWPDAVRWLADADRGNFSLRDTGTSEINNVDTAYRKRLDDVYKSKPPRPSAIIISIDDKGVTKQWGISNNYGAVAVFKDGLWQDLPLETLMTAVSELGEVLVFIDLGENAEQKESLMPAQLKELIYSLPTFYIVRDPIGKDMIDGKLITNTETLDSAMNEALSTLSKSTER